MEYESLSSFELLKKINNIDNESVFFTKIDATLYDFTSCSNNEYFFKYDITNHVYCMFNKKIDKNNDKLYDYFFRSCNNKMILEGIFNYSNNFSQYLYILRLILLKNDIIILHVAGLLDGEILEFHANSFKKPEQKKMMDYIDLLESNPIIAIGNIPM